MAEDLDKIIVAFKNNVEVKNRRYRMKMFERCFVASEAVDFLVESGLSQDREAAVKLGLRLQKEKNLFKHVEDNHEFQDEYLFFRFNPTSQITTTTTPKPSTPFVSQPTGGKEIRLTPANGLAPGMSYRNLVNPRTKNDDEEGFCFAKQVSQRKHYGPPGAPRDTRRSLVYAAAERALRELALADEINSKLVVTGETLNSPFTSQIKPGDMRCLALVAHNHMKPAMKQFIEGHSEILKKFRITGTNTTMTMCRTIFGEDDKGIVYGPSATSGPLGGDAQLAALLCLEDVGAIIFFMDPLSPHPHQADIDSLIRLANVHNVIICTNPTTAIATMWMVRQALINNMPEMFPSFFETLESPSVPEYKAAQKRALDHAINS